jgi:carbonic anhydrase
MNFPRSIIIACCLATPLITSAAEDGTHWAYEGPNGPKHWGDLSPEFISCKVGVNQSPVDISETYEADLPELVIDYNTYTTELVNNGHTAQANVEPGYFLRVGDEEYELLQLHLHTPSEHWLNGEPMLMETHYVHANAQGELAVVAFLHKAGEASPGLEWFRKLIPKEVNQPLTYRAELDNIRLVTIDKSYYRYNGSLTTPPCTEGVRWFVLKEVGEVSLEQQEFYQALIGDDARNPQPLNARIILR